jgi:hypothetical protein
MRLGSHRVHEARYSAAIFERLRRDRAQCLEALTVDVDLNACAFVVRAPSSLTPASLKLLATNANSIVSPVSTAPRLPVIHKPKPVQDHRVLIERIDTDVGDPVPRPVLVAHV